MSPERGRVFHPPLQGEGRGPKGRGVGWRRRRDSQRACALLSPHPAALRAATFPLQGKVKKKARHIFNKRLALPLRILALSSSESGTVCIHSSAGGFMTKR